MPIYYLILLKPILFKFASVLIRKTYKEPSFTVCDFYSDALRSTVWNDINLRIVSKLFLVWHKGALSNSLGDDFI